LVVTLRLLRLRWKNTAASFANSGINSRFKI
jgi:hypothetical protein